MKHIFRFTFVVLILLVQNSVFAQKRDTINLISGGDYLEGGVREGKNFNKFVGGPDNRVIFQQKNTMIYCDSAFLYRAQNEVEAFGSVRVIQNDTITVTGREMYYYGNTKLAKMTGNVVYTDPRLQLFTDYLEYDMVNNLASYFNGGKLVDEVNTLTSEIGNYQTIIKVASFRDSVVLVNPEYVLSADTLKYFTVSKVAQTIGPTRILSENGQILTAEEGGTYETAEKQSIFGLGQIETDEYLLKADMLFSDESRSFYSASQNVLLISKKDNVIITGDEGKYWRERGYTKIYGNAVMKKVIEPGDTLFLAADTLVNVQDTVAARRRTLAYPNVRIFKDDLQGKADSLSYKYQDSTLFLFKDPVLWAETNQIEADSINLLITSKGIKQMNLSVNSFLISEDTLSNYNQIKGRRMIAYFTDNKISKLNVFGNSESIFFALDETESALMGMNKVISSDMTIFFKDSKFQGATFYVQPDGAFIPPHEIIKEDKTLKGFSWRIKEKPTKQEVLGENSTAATEEIIQLKVPQTSQF
jgi:lipopolysaccharide export system protein LptA